MVWNEPAFSLDWAPDAIIVTGLDRSVVHVNPRAEDLFGYRDAELKERPLELLIPEGLAGAAIDSAPLQHVSRIVTCAHRDGTRFRGTARWRPAPGGGDLVVYSIRDVEGEHSRDGDAALADTDAPEAEAEAEAETEAGLRRGDLGDGHRIDFLSLFAHDVRASLQAVQCLCDTLAEHKPNAAAAINEITESIHTLLERVTRFRQATRVEPVVEACKLGDLLGALSRELLPLAERKGLELRVDATSDEIATDPVLFRELLHNLLANAIRHTVTGRVAVRCRPYPERIAIEITDTGGGFDVERGDSLPEHLGEGSSTGGERRGGLGLVIVRQLAQLLQCGVELDSTPGQGTRAIVVAPRRMQRGD